VSAVFRETHYSVICFEKNGLRKDNVDFKVSLSDKEHFKVSESLLLRVYFFVCSVNV